MTFEKVEQDQYFSSYNIAKGLRNGHKTFFVERKSCVRRIKKLYSWVPHKRIEKKKKPYRPCNL